MADLFSAILSKDKLGYKTYNKFKAMLWCTVRPKVWILRYYHTLQCVYYNCLNASGVARVIVLGGGLVASGEGILGVRPQLLHGFRLFERSWTQLGWRSPPSPPNYATAYCLLIFRYIIMICTIKHINDLHFYVKCMPTGTEWCIIS